MVWGLHSLPHLFPTKCIDDDRCRRLSRQEVRRLDRAAAKTYGKLGDKWIGIPVATTGGFMNYRKSAAEKAGFKEFPKDFPGFLELCKALKKNNTPAGFALGHASGDANGWLHWALWAHGGNLSTRTTRSSSTRRRPRRRSNIQGALRHLHSRASRPGTTAPTTRRSWPASSTAPSTASRSTSPRRTTDQEGSRRGHESRAYAGRPDRQADRIASRASRSWSSTSPSIRSLQGLHRLHAGEGAVRPVVSGAQGYLSPFAQAYDGTRSGPRIPRTRRIATWPASARCRPAGIGKLGEKAAAAIADFIVVDMFANYCTGREDVKGAMAIAERQLKRIYR